jgi:hypothetical protein
MRKAQLRHVVFAAAEEVGDEQGAEGDATDAKAGALEEASPVQGKAVFKYLFLHAMLFMSW